MSDSTPLVIPVEELIALYEVNPDTDCWDWIGPTNDRDYAFFKVGKRKFRARRLVYEVVVGAIPEGAFLFSSCDNNRCVNPEHMTPKTQEQRAIEREARLREWEIRTGMIVLDADKIMFGEVFACPGCAHEFEVRGVKLFWPATSCILIECPQCLTTARAVDFQKGAR